MSAQTFSVDMFSLDSQILLIFSAFGALNGFLLSAYLFAQKKYVLENRFLALMVLMLSVRIFKSVLFYFNPEISKSILQIGLSACFLIGPFTYLFTYFHVKNKENLSRGHGLQLSVLFSLIIICTALFPYGDHPILWRNYLYKVVNYVWLAYLLASIWLAKDIIREGLRKRRITQPRQIWLVSVLTGNLLVWLAYYTASYTSYIVGALSFSFVLLIMVMLVVLSKQEDTVTIKYADKKIKQEESNALTNRLDLMMRQQRLYENPNLTMPQVAKKMAMSVPRFSQLLNDNLKKTFPQFVNEYRVNAAKALLSQSDNLTMEVVSEMCGFNSQSTFYNAFKKVTLMTPARYRAQSLAKNTADL